MQLLFKKQNKQTIDICLRMCEQVCVTPSCVTSFHLWPSSLLQEEDWNETPLQHANPQSETVASSFQILLHWSPLTEIFHNKTLTPIVFLLDSFHYNLLFINISLVTSLKFLTVCRAGSFKTWWTLFTRCVTDLVEQTTFWGVHLFIFFPC